MICVSGSGATGSVLKVRLDAFDVTFAVKTIEHKDDEKYIRSMMKDLDYTQACDSKFIIVSYGAFLHEYRLWILMDCLESNMENYYKVTIFIGSVA